MTTQEQPNLTAQSKSIEITKANETGILNQSSQPCTRLTTSTEPVAIRRPLQVRYADEIIKTCEAARLKPMKPNTVNNFRQKLTQLSRVADLMNPADVTKALGYSKLTDATKTSFAFIYSYFCTVNGLKWERPKYKVRHPTPIIPTTNQILDSLSGQSLVMNST